MNKVKAMLCIVIIALVGLVSAAYFESRSNLTGATIALEETASPSAAPTAEASVVPEETPEISETPIPSEPQVYNASLSVVGDLMVHRWQYDFAKSGDSYDFNYSFAEVSQYLTYADLTIGNLETTFAGGEPSGYPRFNTPDSFADALVNAGFDIVSTANNHSNDTGEAGILRTLEVLDAAGLEHFGTYASQEARDTVLIKEVNGIRFAFLSYTYGTNGLSLPEGKDYLVNALDKELIESDIEQSKSEGADVIVVMPHMGNEYETDTNDTFRNWAQFMMECGADVVLASHPHVLQPAEMVSITDEDGSTRDCFVIYSLGNFISSQRTTPRDCSIILNLEFEKVEGGDTKITSISYIPTWVKFVNNSGSYDIQVLSVYDALQDAANGNTLKLRDKDITRLKEVHSEIANMYLGGDVALEKIKNEYWLFGGE